MVGVLAAPQEVGRAVAATAQLAAATARWAAEAERVEVAALADLVGRVA